MTRQGLKKILSLLRQGGVAVVPTDTVYGLIADATQKKAVGRVFAIKKRPRAKQLPLFVHTMRMAKHYALISREQELILSSKWPGPYTAVLKRKKCRPQLYGVHGGTIALRIPDSPKIRLIIKNLKRPVTGTSANRAGKNPSKTVQEARRQLGAKPDLFVDGGTLYGRPSRIVDMTAKPYRTLR